jgi:hypothetical protein
MQKIMTLCELVKEQSRSIGLLEARVSRQETAQFKDVETLDAVKSGFTFLFDKIGLKGYGIDINISTEETKYFNCPIHLPDVLLPHPNHQTLPLSTHFLLHLYQHISLM